MKTKTQKTFVATTKIVVLAKGRENPRNKGTGAFKRYEYVLKSKTVGAFLKVLPKWRATLVRARKEGYIKLVNA